MSSSESHEPDPPRRPSGETPYEPESGRAPEQASSREESAPESAPQPPRDGIPVEEEPTREPVSAPFAGCCLDCGYPLTGVTTGVCPQCGRPFDPDDPNTFGRLYSPPPSMGWVEPRVAGLIFLAVLVVFYVVVRLWVGGVPATGAMRPIGLVLFPIWQFAMTSAVLMTLRPEWIPGLLASMGAGIGIGVLTGLPEVVGNPVLLLSGSVVGLLAGMLHAWNEMRHA